MRKICSSLGELANLIADFVKDNQIEEAFSRYCNEVMCHKEVRRVELQCKVQGNGNYNWESKETITCQECELGYKNCVYVSCDKYHIQ